MRAADPDPAAPTPGYVFFCSSETEKECMQKMLLGSPGSDWRRCARIVQTTALFLYNFNARVLYGPFSALARPALDRDPAGAFGGRFPCQVRITFTTAAKVSIERGKRNPKSGPCGGPEVAELKRLLSASTATRISAPPPRRAASPPAPAASPPPPPASPPPPPPPPPSPPGASEFPSLSWAARSGPKTAAARPVSAQSSTSSSPPADPGPPPPPASSSPPAAPSALSAASAAAPPAAPSPPRPASPAAFLPGPTAEDEEHALGKLEAIRAEWSFEPEEKFHASVLVGYGREFDTAQLLDSLRAAGAVAAVFPGQMFQVADYDADGDDGGSGGGDEIDFGDLGLTSLLATPVDPALADAVATLRGLLPVLGNCLELRDSAAVLEGELARAMRGGPRRRGEVGPS